MDELRQQGELFAANVLPGLLRPEAMQRLELAQAAGPPLRGDQRIAGTLCAALGDQGRFRRRDRHASGNAGGWDALPANCPGPTVSASKRCGDWRHCWATATATPCMPTATAAATGNCCHPPITLTIGKFPTSEMNKLFDLLRLMRPHQWVKNAFVFTGLLFGHAWHDAHLVTQVLMAFAAFCLVSSAVYVFNDIIDVEQDTPPSQEKSSGHWLQGRVGISAAACSRRAGRAPVWCWQIALRRWCWPSWLAMR